MAETPEQLELALSSEPASPAPPAGSGAEVRLAYRPAELAAMVGLSVKAIYRAVGRGELEAARVANGTRLLIPAAAAEEWLVVNAIPPREISCARDGGRKRGAARRPLSEALDALKPTQGRV